MVGLTEVTSPGADWNCLGNLPGIGTFAGFDREAKLPAGHQSDQAPGVLGVAAISGGPGITGTPIVAPASAQNSLQ
jgi:hypothetical protein